MVAIPLAPLSPAEQPLVVLPSGSEAFLPKQQEVLQVLSHPQDDLSGFRPSAIPF